MIMAIRFHSKIEGDHRLNGTLLPSQTQAYTYIFADYSDSVITYTEFIYRHGSNCSYYYRLIYVENIII